MVLVQAPRPAIEARHLRANARGAAPAAVRPGVHVHRFYNHAQGEMTSTDTYASDVRAVTWYQTDDRRSTDET